MTTKNTLRRFTNHNAPSFGGKHYKPLDKDHAAARAGTTRYLAQRRLPNDVPRVLISGHNNKKIGKTVMKGRLRTLPIFTLTLEERATCPRTCAHWLDCYGNQMHWARRVAHGDDLKLRLAGDVERLMKEYPQGILIRLHVLGDFYEPGYVTFWERLLETHPRLNIFGFSAWRPGTQIGARLDQVRDKFWPRFAIRFSNTDGPRNAMTLAKANVEVDKTLSIKCPEQTQKTDCCATCGLCWTTDKNIVFALH